MSRWRLAVAGLVAMALVAPAGAAQEAPAEGAEEATPTHVIVRSFKCNPQGTAVQIFQRGRGVVQEMIDEGKFVDYGLLVHNWGDEWNVVDFFVVDGLDSFFGNFSELLRRLNEADEEVGEDEEELPSLNEVCTEHKDSIYGIVSPPSQEGQ